MTVRTASYARAAAWVIALGGAVTGPLGSAEVSAQQNRLRQPGQSVSASSGGESLESPGSRAGSERRLRLPGTRATTGPSTDDRSSGGSETDEDEEDSSNFGRIENRISSRIETRLSNRISTRIDTRIGTRARSETEDGTAQSSTEAPSEAAPER